MTEAQNAQETDSSGTVEGCGKKKNLRTIRYYAILFLQGETYSEKKTKMVKTRVGIANSSDDTKQWNDLRCSLELKMVTISKTNNKMMMNKMKIDIENTRNDFIKRMEGLPKKVETKVSNIPNKNINDKINVFRNNLDKEVEK